jgi:hypothetical protein
MVIDHDDAAWAFSLSRSPSREALIDKFRIMIIDARKKRKEQQRSV